MNFVPFLARWSMALLAASCLLAHAQSGQPGEPPRAAEEQRVQGSGEFPKGATSKPITFSKDIPLKRDAETAGLESGMGIQFFFMLVIAVAAAAMYWFAKRRQKASGPAVRLPKLLANLGWTSSQAKASHGESSEPLVIHRKRLDRQHMLYVIEWNNAQYLVGGAESRLSVIASTSTASPGRSAPEVEL